MSFSQSPAYWTGRLDITSEDLSPQQRAPLRNSPERCIFHGPLWGITMTMTLPAAIFTLLPKDILSSIFRNLNWLYSGLRRKLERREEEKKGEKNGFCSQFQPLIFVFLLFPQKCSSLTVLIVCTICCCLAAQSCPALCDPTGYSPAGFSACGTSQARRLE